MDDTISKVDNEKMDRRNATMSAEDNKIKYYECNDENGTCEMLEDTEEGVRNQEFILDTNALKPEEKMYSNGKIVITAVLDCEKHEYLQGVKINLYKINGLSPVLIKSENTNEKGKVIFSEIEDGCYRIIEIVDKRYFEKPKYINWNEIIIDNVNKNQEVIIVNKIKRFVAQNKHKHWI